MPTDASPAAPPIIAILRGVEPARVLAIADRLWAAGIRAIEVPLNSPEPFLSIAALAKSDRPADSLVGAGTVLSLEDVKRTQEAGGLLIVAPNSDPSVIAEAKRLGMSVLPGVATATEAFSALRAGARQLKLFPAAALGQRYLKALGAVLPPECEVFPVGGVGADDLYDWMAAGAKGFGFGSELFRPDYTIEAIGERARGLVGAFHAAQQRLGGAPVTKNR
jgi:2-dehydro-3-deoxyphosphogalactonate aldolase